jgi:O-antigen/teichoic acid export membrane protein
MQISYVSKPPPLDPHGGDNQAGVSRSAIARLALNAAKWSYLGAILRAVIQLLAQIVLARLLGPAEFGYYALCFMVVGVGYLFAELGLSAALIQNNALKSNDIERTWTTLLVSGLIVASLLATFADNIAFLLGNPEASSYLRFSSIPLFIQVITSIALALLRKALDFKRIQIAQLTGMIIGQIFVGFTLALILHSAWAMLLAWMTQLLISWFLMFIKVKHTLVPRWPPSSNRLSAFGIRALTANVANWLIENIDNLLVARFFGARTLGFYSVSYNLVRYPTNHLVTGLQAVLFPTSAAVQNDQYALRTAYLASLSLVAIATLPVFTSAAVLAKPLILFLYGAEWKEAVAIMQPLALAMPFHAITAVSGPLLWGMNRVGTECWLQWFILFCFLAIVLVFELTTPVQLAWIVFTVYVARAGLLAISVTSLLKLPFTEIKVCLRGPLILSAIALGSSAAIVVLAEAFPPLSQIFLALGLECLLFLIVFWWAPQWVIAPSLAKILGRFSDSLPHRFASKIQCIINDEERKRDNQKNENGHF